MKTEKKSLVLLVLNLAILVIPLAVPVLTELGIGYLLARGNYGAAAVALGGYFMALAKIAACSTPITGAAGALLAVGSFLIG